MVMKPAEDGHRYGAAHVLDGAMHRSLFAERPMGPQSKYFVRREVDEAPIVKEETEGVRVMTVYWRSNM